MNHISVENLKEEDIITFATEVDKPCGVHLINIPLHEQCWWIIKHLITFPNSYSTFSKIVVLVKHCLCIWWAHEPTNG